MNEKEDDGCFFRYYYEKYKAKIVFLVDFIILYFTMHLMFNVTFFELLVAYKHLEMKKFM